MTTAEARAVKLTRRCAGSYEVAGTDWTISRDADADPLYRWSAHHWNDGECGWRTKAEAVAYVASKLNQE